MNSKVDTVCVFLCSYIAKIVLAVFLMWPFMDNSASAQDFWQRISSGSVGALSFDSDGHIIIGIARGGVYRSTNNGDSFTYLGLKNSFIDALAINSNGNIFAGTSNGLFRHSEDTWSEVLNVDDITTLIFNPNGHLFAASVSSVGIFRSTNNGDSWAKVDTGLTIDYLGFKLTPQVEALAINPSGHIFAGCWGVGGVFRSTNNGDNWTNILQLNKSTSVFAINPSGHIFVGTDSSGIFRSTNNGDNWTPVNDGLQITWIRALDINSSGHIFAGGRVGGVYQSTDNGDNWTAVNSGLTNNIGLIVHDVRVLGIDSSGYIFAGTDAGLFRSVESTIPIIVDPPIGESPDIIFHNTYGEFSKKPFELLRQPLAEVEKDTAKICADGADEATLISIKGSIPEITIEDIGLAFKDDPEGVDPAEFGTFSLHHVDSERDSIVFRYAHPRIVTAKNSPYSELTLQVIDKNAPGAALYEQPVQMYRAPVVMVHGLWGRSKSFEPMRTQFINSNLSPKDLTYLVEYYTRADRHFSDNWPVIKSNILWSIKRLVVLKKFSVGRTNVIAHSMGGILTRLFIQSDDYNDQIARFITLNTPHAGSQWGNFLLEHPCGLALTHFLDDYLNHYTRRGAIFDLRVNSSAILTTLNGGDNLNKNTVPSHAVVTAAVIKDPTDHDSWLYQAVKKVNFYAALATKFGETSVELTQEFINATFNQEENDIIVPVSSQTGGSLQGISFPAIWHVGAQSHSDIIQHVSTLLEQDPNDDGFFSDSGFNPPRNLTYSFEQSSLEDACEKLNTPLLFALNSSPKKSNNTFKITNPLPETTVRPGEEISVTFSGSESFPIVMFTAGNKETGFYSEVDENSSGSFTYTVPEKAIGKIRLVIESYSDTTGLVADDIFINAQPTAELDSISIEPDYLMIGYPDFDITVNGYFKDKIKRDITKIPELILTSSDPDIAHFDENRLLQPVSPGKTKIIATYKGKTTEVPAEVPEGASLPTGIDPKDQESKAAAPPESFVLHQNYPNPFNAGTTFSYTLKKPFPIRLVIYNTAGQTVAEPVNQVQAAGVHKVTWPGAGKNGEALSSGVYFYELQVGQNEKAVKKMVLLR